MPLLNVDSFMRLSAGHRVIWLGGRLGSGKSALAYRLVYEFCMNMGYRYCFSNCYSVWNDNPSDAVLRLNDRGLPQFLDAVFLLDEAGQFMSNPSEAKEWTAYLRKVNVVVILASNTPPHHSIRFLTIQRTLSLMPMGLPAWLYKWTLESLSVEEWGRFMWWRPSEIFGIYDTDGFPDEADDLRDFLKDKIYEAATAAGYRGQKVAAQPAAQNYPAPGIAPKANRQIIVPNGYQTGADSGVSTGTSPVASGGFTPADMDNLWGVADTIHEASRTARKAAVSLSKSRKRGR